MLGSQGWADVDLGRVVLMAGNARFFARQYRQPGQAPAGFLKVVFRGHHLEVDVPCVDGLVLRGCDDARAVRAECGGTLMAAESDLRASHGVLVRRRGGAAECAERDARYRIRRLFSSRWKA